MMFFILILTSFILTQNVTKPFDGHHDWNSNTWTVTAKNNVGYGLACTRLGQAVSFSPINRCSDLSYYQNHPPLISWLVTLSYALFGFGEWAGRLPIILISLVSVTLFYQLSRLLLPSFPALIATLAFTLNPMFAYYGKAINHEPLILMGVLWAVTSWLQWLKLPTRRHYLIFLSSSVWIGLAGWHGYIMFPILYVVFYTRLPSKILASLPLFMLVGIFALHQAHARSLLGYWPTRDLLMQLASRMGKAPVNGPDLTHFSYGRFFRQEISWLRAYYSEILLMSGVISALTLFASATFNYRNRTLVALGLFGVGIPFIFAQQAFIHDYLNLFLLPFLALSTGLVVQGLVSLLSANYVWLGTALILIFIYVSHHDFYLALNNSLASAQYVRLGKLITALPYSRVSIVADNFYTFAQPFISNYAYGKTVIAHDRYDEQTLKQLIATKSVDALITVSTNPLYQVPSFSQLVSHLPQTTYAEFTVYALQ